MVFRLANGDVLLEIKGMTKTFGPVTALDSVDLTVCRGEVRGLIGENGSGKSTLSSIFSGMQGADSGEMKYLGHPWHPRSMEWAMSHGVGMIVQESGTVPGITVAENIFLCETGSFAGGGLVSVRKMRKAAQAALADIGADGIDAGQIAGMLDMTERKLVEVAKVWLRRPQVLVVDESTTSLSQKGREIVYSLMKRLTEAGGAVVFISHDIDEIKEKCDTLTVLRDGHIIRTFMKSEFSDDAIRTAMIGREMRGDYYRSDYDGKTDGKTVLKAERVRYRDKVIDFSLDAKEGEIVGIGGLSDCGMHDVGRLLYGALAPDRGKVTVKGHEVTNPSVAMSHKMGYAAKDRDTESLCLEASVKDNIAIAGLSIISPGLIITSGAEKRYVDRQIKSMQVKCYTMNQPVSQLSGGNKQKVVFGKWIGCGSDILILDCPTRGVDIGVKQTMYQLIYKMKREGKTVIMISEEMTELMGMSDRIIIMKNGRITREFPRSKSLTDADLIKYMV